MSGRQKLTLTLIVALTFLAHAPLEGEAGHRRGATYLVYVGTMTNGNSQGIYAYRFDPATGKSHFLGLSAATPNPTFLLVSENERYLYAVNESGNDQGEKGNTVSAFRIDSHTGKLAFINQISLHKQGVLRRCQPMSSVAGPYSEGASGGELRQWQLGIITDHA